MLCLQNDKIALQVVKVSQTNSVLLEDVVYNDDEDDNNFTLHGSTLWNNRAITMNKKTSIKIGMTIKK